jgi:hypothetical protein
MAAIDKEGEAIRASHHAYTGSENLKARQMLWDLLTPNTRALSIKAESDRTPPPSRPLPLHHRTDAGQGPSRRRGAEFCSDVTCGARNSEVYCCACSGFGACGRAEVRRSAPCCCSCSGFEACRRVQAKIRLAPAPGRGVQRIAPRQRYRCAKDDQRAWRVCDCVVTSMRRYSGWYMWCLLVVSYGREDIPDGVWSIRPGG